MKKLVSLFIIALLCCGSYSLKAQEVNFMGIPMVSADTVKAHLPKLGFSPIKKSKDKGFRGYLFEKDVVAYVTENLTKFHDGDTETLDFYLEFLDLSSAEVTELFDMFTDALTDEYNVEPVTTEANSMLFWNEKNASFSQPEKCKSILIWELSRFKNFIMYHTEDKLCIFYLDMNIQQ